MIEYMRLCAARMTGRGIFGFSDVGNGYARFFDVECVFVVRFADYYIVVFCFA